MHRPASADGGAMAITERAYEQGGLLVAAPPGDLLTLSVPVMLPGSWQQLSYSM